MVTRLRDLATEVDREEAAERLLVPFDGSRFLEDLADQLEDAAEQAPIPTTRASTVAHIAGKLSRA